ncbi:MAG TPA: NAD(P)(+) transhydrogenase (Re/Si-specific) subunit beta, partial [Thermoanaerobacterales bacterium]|nr:NAD(P)(+) transhydrogenase (Re/Si-specific) subunit beta [Thermoanaerobacterales bacterium]
MIGTYEIVSIILSILVLVGIKLMSSPKTAVQGNRIGAVAMLAAIVVVLNYNGIVDVPLLWIAMFTGGFFGYIMAKRVKMIQMPQMVALLNGLGGGASALVALVEIFERYQEMILFGRLTSQLALAVGAVTLSGSLIAAGKLDRRISQRPVILNNHSQISNTVLLIIALLVIVASVTNISGIIAISIITAILALAYGVLFAIRVGGADMPITISLLNSFSGLAGAICGFTIGDPLLVAVGAIVGASGLILTQIMCNAMNRSLIDILSGSYLNSKSDEKKITTKEKAEKAEETPVAAKKSPGEILKAAKKVVIVPGYGMAIAQAQSQVKALYDTLESEGKEVKFAIHPVAGRMPGHMNVLLAEVDVPYDKLCEMDAINPEFGETDVAIVVGACDVVNPAANTAEGTPIYGMPVLKVEEAKNVIVCNLDTKPGYSGVDNSLYELPNVYLMLGNAVDTLKELLSGVKSKDKPKTAEDGSIPQETASEETASKILKDAKKVVIVPGYGMAIAQAQSQVKSLYDTLESQGKEVKFAIHPVAGRMPGHMNVLLAEVDVPYDKLW